MARATLENLIVSRGGLRGQPSRVVFRPFRFATFGSLYEEVIDILMRLQGTVVRQVFPSPMKTLFGFGPHAGGANADTVGRQVAITLPVGRVQEIM